MRNFVFAVNMIYLQFCQKALPFFLLKKMTPFIYGLNSTILAGSNATNGTHSELLGFLGLALCSILWGSGNLPIKHFETGDGKLEQ